VSGLVLGFIYALVSLGFSLSWGISNLVDVSLPYIAVLSAYVAYWLYLSSRINIFVFILIVPLLMGLVSLGLSSIIVPKLIRQSDLNSFVVYFGISYMLQGLMAWWWSPTDRTISVSFLNSTAIQNAFLILSWRQILTASVTAAAYLILILFLTRTRTGTAIRASAQNKKGAQIVGINLRRIYYIVQVIAGMAAALGGVLLALNYSFDPDTGALWIGYLFLIVVLGSKGSVLGSLIGGVILGVVQGTVGLFVPQLWTTVVSFVILVVVLTVRPQGLLKGRI
jgi:branched-chain amino acid transport system permease protein